MRIPAREITRHRREHYEQVVEFETFLALVVFAIPVMFGLEWLFFWEENEPRSWFFRIIFLAVSSLVFTYRVSPILFMRKLIHLRDGWIGSDGEIFYLFDDVLIYSDGGEDADIIDCGHVTGRSEENWPLVRRWGQDHSVAIHPNLLVLDTSESPIKN